MLSKSSAANIFTILFILISCKKESSNLSDLNFRNLFPFEKNIDVPFTDSTVIAFAIFGYVNNNSITIASGIKPPVIKYNFNSGKTIVYNKFGEGPFELTSVFNLQPGIEDETYVLDLPQSKLLVLDEKLVPKMNLRLLTKTLTCLQPTASVIFTDWL